jgi:cell wall-associated NlpC family hydrolase
METHDAVFFDLHRIACIGAGARPEDGACAPVSLSSPCETEKLRGVTKSTASPFDRGAHYPGWFRMAPALRVAAGIVLVVSLVTGCGHESVRPTHGPATTRTWQTLPPPNPVASNAVLMRALGLVGTPYRYGGNTPEGGFDCSGLVNYVYRDMLDLRLPRTSRALAAFQGPRIAEDDWWRPTWCSSAVKAASATSASMSARADSFMLRAPAGQFGWTAWTARTGGTITRAPCEFFTEMNGLRYVNRDVDRL